MPLQDQEVTITFNEGIDTKSDSKSLPTGKLTALENGVFDKYGSIRKRYGYDALSSAIESTSEGTAIDAGRALATYKDQLLLFDGSDVYAYLESSEKWINRGEAISVNVTSDPIVRNTYQQTTPDAAYCNGVSVYAYQDSRGGIRYSAVDASNGAFIVSDVQIDATGSKPRCVAFGNLIYIFFVNAGVISYVTVNSYLPSQVSSVSSRITDLNSSAQLYDAIVADDKLFIGYGAAGGGVYIRYLSSLDILSDVAVITDTPSTALCLAVNDTAYDVYCFFANGDEVYGCSVDNNNNLINDSSFVIGAGGNIYAMTAIQSGATTMTVYYDQVNASTYKYAIYYVTYAADASSGSDTPLMYSVGLASKAFTYNGSNYLLVLHSSTLQSTYFLKKLDGGIVAKATPNLAGAFTASCPLPNASVVEAGKFLIATSVKTKLVSEDGDLFTLTGINGSNFDFEAASNFGTVEHNNTLFLVGGVIQGYDGVAFTEYGFHLYPENITATPSATDGYITAGTYQYIVTYEWTDNNGYIHRSTTSVPVSVTTSGSTSSVTLSIPYLSLTAKSNVRIIVYRTEANNALFYRLSSIASPGANTASISNYTFVDTVADSSIISNELLYTTGGVLDNGAPPGASMIAAYRNRIFLCGLEDNRKIVYTKTNQLGEATNFVQDDLFLRYVDALGQNVTAFAKMDQYLIIFKESAIYWIAGNGPDNLGNNDDISEPRLITTDVGCSNPDSIVNTDRGLMFKSSKGIYMLGRDLSLGYIGADVEEFNDLSITSATLVPNANQVRFTSSDGDCLVYDYAFNQWSTFTNHIAVDSIVYDNHFTFLKSDGTAYKENWSSFTDGAAHIKLAVETSFLSFAGIQGFQRIKRIYVIGDYKGPHYLDVKFAYDDVYANFESKSIDVNTALGVTTYGSEATYGAGTVYGGVAPVYQLDVSQQRQKCMSVKVRLEDNQSNNPDNYNEGMSLSGLSFVVGVKPGLNRLPAGQKA